MSRSWFKLLGPALLILAWCSGASAYDQTLPLPLPGFEVSHQRGDPDRAARPAGAPYDGPLIDAHAHLDPSPEWSPAVMDDALVELWDLAGVEAVLLMPAPDEGRMGTNGDERRRALAGAYPDRVRLMCGSDYVTHGLHKAFAHGYGAHRSESLITRLVGDLASGKYVGAGEMGLFLFAGQGRAPIEIAPNYLPFVSMTKEVAKSGLWLDLHAEPVEPDGPSREAELFGGLELIMHRSPGLKLILSHTAMTNAANARAILQTYPTVMMNFNLTGGHAQWRHLEPVCNEEFALYEDWAALFEEMPERFMVGTDAAFGRPGEYGPERYEQDIERMRRALGSLSPEAARLIASENARRAFGF